MIPVLNRSSSRRKAPAASGGTFDPSTLPGLYIWSEADQVSGHSDGDSLTSITNGYTAGNFSGACTYKVGIINSKPVFRFNGTTDGMRTANITTATNDKWTEFIVVKNAASGVAGCFRDINTGTGSENETPYSDGVVYDAFMAEDRITQGTPSVSFSSSAVLFSTTMYGYNPTLQANAYYRSYVNGTLFYSNTGSHYVASTVGYGLSKRNPRACDIAAVILCKDDLQGTSGGTSYYNLTTSYLKTKYGIS